MDSSFFLGKCVFHCQHLREGEVFIEILEVLYLKIFDITLMTAILSQRLPLTKDFSPLRVIQNRVQDPLLLLQVLQVFLFESVPRMPHASAIVRLFNEVLEKIALLLLF